MRIQRQSPWNSFSLVGRLRLTLICRKEAKKKCSSLRTPWSTKNRYLTKFKLQTSNILDVCAAATFTASSDQNRPSTAVKQQHSETIPTVLSLGTTQLDGTSEVYVHRRARKHKRVHPPSMNKMMTAAVTMDNTTTTTSWQRRICLLARDSGLHKRNTGCLMHSCGFGRQLKC